MWKTNKCSWNGHDLKALTQKMRKNECAWWEKKQALRTLYFCFTSQPSVKRHFWEHYFVIRSTHACMWPKMHFNQTLLALCLYTRKLKVQTRPVLFPIENGLCEATDVITIKLNLQISLPVCASRWCIGSVCVPTLCLSVWAVTFERVNIETSFLVWWYTLIIPRSVSSVKIIYWKMLTLLPGHPQHFW